jgi:nitroreductase
MDQISVEAVDLAIASRRSVRAFLPTPVAREIIVEILNISSRAPSGTNTQPWQVHVLTGQSKEALSAKILATYNDPTAASEHVEEYRYYPSTWVTPYIERRRQVGWDLYGLQHGRAVLIPARRLRSPGFIASLPSISVWRIRRCWFAE